MVIHMVLLGVPVDLGVTSWMISRGRTNEELI